MFRIRPLKVFRFGRLFVLVLLLLRAAAEIVPEVATLVGRVGPPTLVRFPQLVVRFPARRVRQFKVGVGDGLELDGRGSPARIVGGTGRDAVGVALEGLALVGRLDLLERSRFLYLCWQGSVSFPSQSVVAYEVDVSPGGKVSDQAWAVAVTLIEVMRACRVELEPDAARCISIARCSPPCENRPAHRGLDHSAPTKRLACLVHLPLGFLLMSCQPPLHPAYSRRANTPAGQEGGANWRGDVVRPGSEHAESKARRLT